MKKQNKIYIKAHLIFLFSVFLFTALAAAEKNRQPLLLEAKKNSGDSSAFADPLKYLATLEFDGKDCFDKGEHNFPTSFIFNTTQDANNDGAVDTEDNLENLIPYSIGNNLNGTGRTGLQKRGPNNQQPAVYFHVASAGVYKVYEYWFYYADNDWINNHEHDWEKYFVYEQTGVPKYIKTSRHKWFDTHLWSSIIKDDNHPSLSVKGGSHAIKIVSQDGVKIRYNGEITKNKGTLLIGNNQTIPWTIYSNDDRVSGIHPYLQKPAVFYYGDPYYTFNKNELGAPNPSPWMRSEWSSPPMP